MLAVATMVGGGSHHCNAGALTCQQHLLGSVGEPTRVAGMCFGGEFVPSGNAAMTR